MPTQIADIIVPAEFTAYIVENSLVSSALFQSGVAVPNGIMSAQLQAGAEFFTVPFWKDLPDTEANLSSDDPTVNSTPLKVSALQQIVRKSFVNQSWAQMDLASELSGSDALARIQNRVLAYWERQWEKRLIASLLGVLYSNVANNAADMVIDISGLSGASADFSGDAVIDAALTLGDRLGDVKMIAMHSTIYGVYVAISNPFSDGLKKVISLFFNASNGSGLRHLRSNRSRNQWSSRMWRRADA